MKLQSDFAILDVKRGRTSLRKHLEDGGGAASVSVAIIGKIDLPWGADDGESQEFEVRVEVMS